MKNRSKKYFTVLAVYCGVSVLLMGLAYIFLLQPQDLAMEKMKSDIKKVTEKHDLTLEARSDKAKIRMEKKLTEAQNLLNQFVTENDMAAKVSFEIGQMGNELNVVDFSAIRSESQSVTVIDGYKNLGEVWIDIKFECDFKQFATFLNNLERHNPYIFVEQFTIEKTSKSNGMHEAKMGVAFFTKSKNVAKLK